MLRKTLIVAWATWSCGGWGVDICAGQEPAPRGRAGRATTQAVPAETSPATGFDAPVDPNAAGVDDRYTNSSDYPPTAAYPPARRETLPPTAATSAAEDVAQRPSRAALPATGLDDYEGLTNFPSESSAVQTQYTGEAPAAYGQPSFHDANPVLPHAPHVPPEYVTAEQPPVYTPECVLPQCEECVCCRCSPFYFRADGMLLTRTNSGGRPLAAAGANGPIVLDANNFSFPLRPVSHFVIGSEFCCDYALEIEYYGLANWRSSRNVTAVNNNLTSPFSQFATNPIGGFADSDQANSVAANYASHLYNLEANFFFCNVSHCGWGELRLLTGGRIFNLTEGFNLNTVTLADTASTQVRTVNDLYGWQIGGRWHSRVTDWMHFNMDVKLAVLGNDARVATETSAAFNGVLNEGASRGQTCFMADIAPVLRFDITEHLSLRLGYYAMYLSGVALAPENFVPTPPPGAVGRTPQINTGGHTVYHGLTVGAEYRF